MFVYSQWFYSIVTEFAYFDRYAHFLLPNLKVLKKQTSGYHGYQGCKSWVRRNSFSLQSSTHTLKEPACFINLPVHTCTMELAGFQTSWENNGSEMSHPKPSFLCNGWYSWKMTESCYSNQRQTWRYLKTDPGSHYWRHQKEMDRVLDWLEMSHASMYHML